MHHVWERAKSVCHISHSNSNGFKFVSLNGNWAEKWEREEDLKTFNFLKLLLWGQGKTHPAVEMKRERKFCTLSQFSPFPFLFELSKHPIIKKKG